MGICSPLFSSERTSRRPWFFLHPAPLLKHSEFLVSFEEYKGEFDAKFWLRRIGEIVVERRIDVVLPISEFAIRTLSEHRQTLSWAAKLPQLPNPHAFDVATDKANLADFLASHGLPHPPTVVVTTGVPVHGRLSTLGFPVLAKPPHLSGGTGIGRMKVWKGSRPFLANNPKGTRVGSCRA